MWTPHYEVKNYKIKYEIRAALVSDLHGYKGEKVLETLKSLSPDLILVPGDLCEDLTTPEGMNDPGLWLLNQLVQIAPVFYSIGNHELGRIRLLKKEWDHKPLEILQEIRAAIQGTGAIMLEDDFISWNGICIGGLTSGLRFGDGKPYMSWMPRYLEMPGFKLLLSHHPEYYSRYLKDMPIDCIVSGHAHGGQWRIGKIGLYAPGQGVFPKYVSGMYDGRLAVSTGLGNQTLIPRMFNPAEIPVVTFMPK